MMFLKTLFYSIISIISIIILLVYSLIVKKRKELVIFGSTPIINNKYWSNALMDIGIPSETLMRNYFSSINKKEDFDKYFDDLIPKIFRRKYLNEVAYLLFVWPYIIKNAKIVVMPFSGVVFKKYFWRIEYLLLKLNGIKVIILPYGSDFLMYSKIKDPSIQNVLLVSYPNAAREEKTIEKKVFFWSKHANIVLGGFGAVNGMPRWDISIHQYIQINTREWVEKKIYSNHNGINGVVKIMHTPNHRGFKGTEYLINAVKKLKDEGLNVELVLVEKMQNAQVRALMQEVDILAEQFIAIGYALSGMEGMASGLPVLANLDNKVYTERLRRYSFLNECPILSTTPESIEDNLRLLITNPELRKELGELGRKYAEKYHSYEMAQHIFTNIFKKLDGKDIDLMNLYHPLKSKYVRSNYIKTPLINNRYIEKA